MSSTDLILRFWGVRGSIAANPSKIGNHTSCVELTLSPEHSLFFDAGTGIRAATQNRKLKKMTLYISHFHWDHIQGLPFIEGLGRDDFQLDVISAFPDTLERLQHLFDSRFHPVQLDRYKSKLSFHYLPPKKTFKILGLDLQTGVLNHPGDSYACLVSGAQSSLLYATDSDYDPVPPDSEALFRQADWAIVDSQFLMGDSIKKYDFGHASYQHAIDTCARFGVKDSFLFHFDPHYEDADLERLEAQAMDYVQSRFAHNGPKVWVAHEGMERRIGR
jgi:ribonuclease BN (tRNA processing enzyme)